MLLGAFLSEAGLSMMKRGCFRRWCSMIFLLLQNFGCHRFDRSQFFSGSYSFRISRTIGHGINEDNCAIAPVDLLLNAYELHECEQV